MITLESVFGRDLYKITDEALDGKNLELLADGVLRIDGEEAAPCLMETLRRTKTYDACRSAKIDEAKEILRSIAPSFPFGASVHLFGIEFTKTENNFCYSI